MVLSLLADERDDGPELEPGADGKLPTSVEAVRAAAEARATGVRRRTVVRGHSASRRSRGRAGRELLPPPRNTLERRDAARVDGHGGEQQVAGVLRSERDCRKVVAGVVYGVHALRERQERRRARVVDLDDLCP